MRTLVGVAVGLAIGGAVNYVFQDSGAGICAGCLVGLTIRFWVGAPRGHRG
jgi:hypothetical protein